MLLFYRTFLVSHRQVRSPAPTLHIPIFTLNFIFFFVIDLEVLFEAFLCLLAFRIVLLQILAKVDEVDLDLKVTFADIFLFGFEVLLVSG